jgi:hypothetical protein
MIKVSIDRQVMQSVLSGVADQLKSKIDMNQVKKICKKRYGIETINGIEHKNANIVVIKNQAACKLDFDVRFYMSILITAKEDSNSTLTEYYDMPEDFNDISEEVDDLLEEELEDIPESNFDNIREDIRAELKNFIKLGK